MVAPSTRTIPETAKPVSGAMAERRERILKAARAIIAKNGIEGLTMRCLAQRSRVTVPTLYNLIGGRDQVILEAVRDRTSHFLADLRVPKGTDPAARVLLVAEASTREFLGSPDYYRSLLGWMLTAAGAEEVRRDVGATFTHELRVGLEALSEAGGLAAWAEPAHLADRIAAHLASASLEWANGSLSAPGFRALAQFESALALRAVVVGPAIQRRLERIAREAQTRLVRRRKPRRVRTQSGGRS